MPDIIIYKNSKLFSRVLLSNLNFELILLSAVILNKVITQFDGKDFTDLSRTC